MSSFSLFALLRSRFFIIISSLLTLISFVFASMPLLNVLGFEYNLFFGLLATIAASQLALSGMHLRQKMGDSSFLATLTRLLAAAFLAILPALLIILLNALRVRNCNLLVGLAFWGLMPLVGIVFGVSIGMLLSTLSGRILPLVLIYLLPILNILWAIYRGLLHPPIFAYSHYFSFYPGAIYDEVRKISSTLIIFRLETLVIALFIFVFLAIFAGEYGILGARTWTWRRPFLLKDPQALDGRFSFAGSKEIFLGLIALLLFSFVLLLSLHAHRYELGYVQTGPSIRRALGGIHRTAHFIIHYDPNGMKADLLERIARDHEFRYHQLVQFFGHRPKKKIRSYLFRSAAQKSHFMGAARTMIARPWAYEFYLHGYRFPHPVLKHEMAHVFSAQFGAGPLKLSARYGILFNPALIEGIAVAADWRTGELTPHQWSKAMLDLKIAPLPEQILGPMGFFANASIRSYTIAGSFSRYLIDHYGMKKYKLAYGNADFQAVYRRSLPSLSSEWRHFLATKVSLSRREKQIAAYRFRGRYSIFAKVCPHEIAALKEKVSSLIAGNEYFRALALQKKISSIEPNAYNGMTLLYLYRKTRQFEKAFSLIEKMLDQYSEKKYPILRAKLELKLANLLYQFSEKFPSQERKSSWRKRRIFARTPLQIYRALLKRPMPYYQQRSLWVRIYALQDKKVTKAVFDYLENSSYFGLLHLQKLLLKRKHQPLLAYLLARRFFYAEEYREAIPLLREAFDGLEAFPIRIESLRLIALAHFYLGHYRLAAHLFGQLASYPLPLGLKQKAWDWKERSLWEKRNYGGAPTKEP